jgi:hypothetical protein
MENTKVNKFYNELSIEEMKNIEAGGFWKDVGTFLFHYQQIINNAQANGSSGMEFMGGA